MNMNDVKYLRNKIRLLKAINRGLREALRERKGNIVYLKKELYKYALIIPPNEQNVKDTFISQKTHNITHNIAKFNEKGDILCASRGLEHYLKTGCIVESCACCKGWE